MRTILAIAVASGLLFNGEVKAALIAAWDFSGLEASPNTPAIIPATVGNGSLDLSTFVTEQRTSFSGTILNAFPGGEAVVGLALAIEGQSANGNSMILSLSMTGYEGLVLSFATRGTATGFSSHEWAYSTDGLNYTILSEVNTANTGTSFVTRTVDFSSASEVDDVSLVFIKLTLDGATSGSGNNRFDNIQFNATLVPEPAEWGLMAAMGLMAVCGWRTWREHKLKTTIQNQ